MRIYIIYCISDYAHPVAMTLNKDIANKYVQKYNQEEKWARYYVESRLATNAITEFSCE